jgi:hypothetical protein
MNEWSSLYNIYSTDPLPLESGWLGVQGLYYTGIIIITQIIIQSIVMLSNRHRNSSDIDIMTFFIMLIIGR